MGVPSRLKYRPALFLALALAIVLVAASPARAQQTLGTNLATHNANANIDCTAAPSLIGPLPSGVTSCTYVSVALGAQSTATPFPGGVITRVRVRAAAPTGPMQVVVARQIGTTTTGIGCCFYAGETQTFTPRANATTAVDVRLPVENSIDPVNGVRVVDFLGLSVLSPGVAIPGQWPGNSQLEGSLGLTPGDAVAGRVDGYGNALIPLLSADFVPLCGGGAAAAVAAEEELGIRGDGPLPEPPWANSSAGGRCLGGASPRDGSLTGGRAAVPLDCNLTSRCRGRLQLLATKGGARLGDSKFKIDSGDRKRVRVKLSKKGKRKASGKRKIKVRAKIKVSGGPNGSAKITLKR